MSGVQENEMRCSLMTSVLSEETGEKTQWGEKVCLRRFGKTVQVDQFPELVFRFRGHSSNPWVMVGMVKWKDQLRSSFLEGERKPGEEDTAGIQRECAARMV